jgi:hypothetical protein
VHSLELLDIQFEDADKVVPLHMVAENNQAVAEVARMLVDDILGRAVDVKPVDNPEVDSELVADGLRDTLIGMVDTGLDTDADHKVLGAGRDHGSQAVEDSVLLQGFPSFSAV